METKYSQELTVNGLAVHDTRILRNSNIQAMLNENQVGVILLGDEGYPLTPWLTTPSNTDGNNIQQNTYERALDNRAYV